MKVAPLGHEGAPGRWGEEGRLASSFRQAGLAVKGERPSSEKRGEAVVFQLPRAVGFKKIVGVSSTGPVKGRRSGGFERGQSAVAGGGEATERSGGGPRAERQCADFAERSMLAGGGQSAPLVFAVCPP